MKSSIPFHSSSFFVLLLSTRPYGRVYILSKMFLKQDICRTAGGFCLAVLTFPYPHATNIDSTPAITAAITDPPKKRLPVIHGYHFTNDADECSPSVRSSTWGGSTGVGSQQSATALPVIPRLRLIESSMTTIDKGQTRTSNVGTALQKSGGSTRPTRSAKTANPASTFQFRHICIQFQIALRGEAEDGGSDVCSTSFDMSTRCLSCCWVIVAGVCPLPTCTRNHIIRPMPTGQASTGSSKSRFCIVSFPFSIRLAPWPARAKRPSTARAKPMAP
jgi:hypothetical protein